MFSALAAVLLAWFCFYFRVLCMNYVKWKLHIVSRLSSFPPVLLRSYKVDFDKKKFEFGTTPKSWLKFYFTLCLYNTNVSLHKAQICVCIIQGAAKKRAMVRSRFFPESLRWEAPTDTDMQEINVICSTQNLWPLRLVLVTCYFSQVWKNTYYITLTRIFGPAKVRGTPIGEHSSRP